MKQIKLTFLLIALLCMVGTQTFAYDAKINGIYYSFSGTNATVTYYSNSSSSNKTAYSGAVIIPEAVTYNGKTYSVTSIGWSAFSGCSGLTSVTIPGSVTNIGGGAFSGCSGLKEVNFNAIKCTLMGRANNNSSMFVPVFGGCNALTTLRIGDNVQLIPKEAFDGCSGLTTVTIGNSVTSIGSDAFDGCSGLTTVTIGNSVTSINYFSFDSTYPIAKVIWLTNTPPSGYDNVVAYVHYVSNDLYTEFSNKTVYPFLSSVFEVDGVKYVPVSPSERTCDAIDCLYDESAAQIRIGETVNFKGVNMAVKQVHPYALIYNKHIDNVELNFQGDVGNYAFYGCTGVQNITIGNNVGNVGNYTFYNCTALQSANVSNSGSIGERAFQSCTALQTATLGEKVSSLGQSSFSGCAKLQSIVIPNAVTTIGAYAFQNCKSMVSAKMGSGVKTINSYTFLGLLGTDRYADRQQCQFY